MIDRFMHNEIPYTEFINGQSVDKYYHSDIDDGREYLDERARDEFDHSEVVVAEFCNLDTDSEIEIFSRVQLGTPLTSAEKLKAHSSPIARYCSDVYDEYRSDLSKLFADVRSHIFQYVSQLVLLICNDSDKYQGSVLKLEKFLSDNDINPTPELKRYVAHALNTIAQLINESPAIFTHLDGEKNPFRPMEFLMFGYYLSKCRRRRSIKEYEEDCVGLRKHMHASPTGIRMGNPCYRVALEWIDERMEITGQTPALIRNPGFASSTDTDEAPEEDENAVEDALAFYKKSTKRPLRDECLEASSSRHPSRPVARRGGKAPRARH
ncbi:hypothetical protein BJV82DRAFT_589750 [Fennellomyces sp. T-0311]|nr:hypothetical protein BJV82DRAFT_589750 [Fennellomyces sp. T-0311]